MVPGIIIGVNLTLIAWNVCTVIKLNEQIKKYKNLNENAEKYLERLKQKEKL